MTFYFLRQVGGDLLKSVGSTIGSNVDEIQLEHAIQEAVAKTSSANHKMDELRVRQTEVNAAAGKFKVWEQEYHEKKKKAAIFAVVTSVVEIGFSLGVAIYTGGAGLPLTVGAVNKAMKTVSTFQPEKLVD